MAVLVKKLATAKWQVSINHNNKQRKIVVSSKGAAISLKDLIEVELASYKLGILEPKRKKISFRSVAVDWQADHFDNIKPATQERYEIVLRLYLIPKFGKDDIRDITRAEVLRFLKGLKAKGRSSSLIQVISSVLAQVFLFGLDCEIREKTPMVEIGKSLKLKRTKNETPPYAHEELALLLLMAPDKYRLFFMTLMRTGL